jgi:hypothetical protein
MRAADPVGIEPPPLVARTNLLRAHVINDISSDKPNVTRVSLVELVGPCFNSFASATKAPELAMPSSTSTCPRKIRNDISI